MARRKDFSEDAAFQSWSDSFSRAIDKKRFQQGTGVYIQRKRTASTAINLIGKLLKLPVASVRLLLNVYHDDQEFSTDLIQVYQNTPRGFC